MTNNQTPVIEFSNVSKTFSVWKERPNSIKKALTNIFQARNNFKEKIEFKILDDVSFKIYPGEFVGIMGRNGVGKSSMLKMMTGIYQPTKGEIKINGKIAPLLELGAGFSEELSGYENIFLNAAVLEFGRKKIDAKLNDIINFSGIGEHIYMPIRTYSSGMLIRLGFSIAVHLDAPIFLFDEILAVGDAGFQKKCLDRIKDLYSQGKSIILVTHSPEQVKQFCNRSIIIDNKKVIFDGHPNEGTAVYSSLFT